MNGVIRDSDALLGVVRTVDRVTIADGTVVHDITLYGGARVQTVRGMSVDASITPWWVDRAIVLYMQPDGLVWGARCGGAAYGVVPGD